MFVTIVLTLEVAVQQFKLIQQSLFVDSFYRSPTSPDSR